MFHPGMLLEGGEYSRGLTLIGIPGLVGWPRRDTEFGCSEITMMIVSLRQHSLIALLIGGIALSIAPSRSAFAQIKMDMSKGQPVDPATLEERKKVDQEYQSKLKSIPDQAQKKPDPWANVRGSNSSQK
jgi:hypothetical protein